MSSAFFLIYNSAGKGNTKIYLSIYSLFYADNYRIQLHAKKIAKNMLNDANVLT